MNLIEAIKSRKRFRRKGETSWYSAISDNIYEWIISAISRENFVADDWEIESQPVTITREQFDAAWDRWYSKVSTERFSRDDLAKELGL